MGLPFLEMMEVDILGKESEGSSHRMHEHFVLVPGCSSLIVRGLLEAPVLGVLTVSSVQPGKAWEERLLRIEGQADLWVHL